MIDSPAQALRRRRWETLGVMFLLALAMFLPGVLLMGAERVHAHTESWLLSYQPVIYVQEGATAEQVTALTDELSRWPGVEQVLLHDRDQALAELSAELGEERVHHLGISSAMLPRSVELVPGVPLQGHIELASKVAALEVREEVAAVDVPDSEALKLMAFMRTMAVCAILLCALLTATALVMASAFLRRLQDEERDMSELLEVFGATRRSLARPSMARSLILSAWAGGGATMALFVAQLNLTRWIGQLFGTQAPVPLTWIIVFLPLLCSPFVGLLLGRLTMGVQDLGVAPGLRKAHSGVVSLLRFSRRGVPALSV